MSSQNDVTVTSHQAERIALISISTILLCCEKHVSKSQCAVIVANARGRGQGEAAGGRRVPAAVAAVAALHGLDFDVARHLRNVNRGLLRR